MVFEPQGMFTEKAEVVLEVFGTFGVACGAVQQCFYAADAVFLGCCFFGFGGCFGVTDQFLALCIYKLFQKNLMYKNHST